LSTLLRWGNTAASMTHLFADTALLPTGWARDVLIEWDATGYLVRVEAGAAPGSAERAKGAVLPGMPNLHSHAFQRAMAGLTERSSAAEDSFWSWRDVMYRFVLRLSPEDLRAIAAQLYVEMLQAGYTSVAEFHYVHHDRDGAPYADRATMSEAVIVAAKETGIGLTLLPVLYQTSGFGGVPPTAGQRRFVTSTEDFLALWATLRARHGADAQLAFGIAPHSLRAAPPDTLAPIVEAVRREDGAAPIHMHVAEQTREVEECLAWSGARPVAWLLDHHAVDARWCLVHATHIDKAETRRLAASGAVAGLCPTTEANLGDGFFPLPLYRDAGGLWGIGSDSHVSVSPVEELRWLEYGQRLLARRRNVAIGSAGGSSGATLWRAALSGGARALRRPVGVLAPGCRADLIVLDADVPALAGKTDDALLDAVVFAGNVNPVRDVMAGGAWLVRDGRHSSEKSILRDYRAALARLTEEI
jgi:formimidoylglutamate deiminase